MPQYKLLIQRYPYGGVEASECVSWLMATFQRASLDPRFSVVKSSWVNDTPITMTRNQSFIAAKKAGFDFMLLVDSDMAPDVELRTDPLAVPFFDAAVNYALKSPVPCVVAAPYVGPPPLENVYVFRWANRGNTLHPKAAGAKLDQFGREEAALLAGIQPVGALPTGLMLLDLRVLDNLPHPYTYYEYHQSGRDECPGCHQKARGPEREKASTEDVTFTRDLGMLGVPILCAWSSWAGHVKRYVAGKPRMYDTDIVAHKMRDAVARRVFPGEQMHEVEMDPELARILAMRGNNQFRSAADGRVWTPEPDAALRVAVDAAKPTARANVGAGQPAPPLEDATAGILIGSGVQFATATTTGGTAPVDMFGRPTTDIIVRHDTGFGPHYELNERSDEPVPHPLDQTAAILAAYPPGYSGPGPDMPVGVALPNGTVIDIESFLQPERGTVPSRPVPQNDVYAAPPGVPVEMAPHKLKFGGLDPGFANLMSGRPGGAVVEQTSAPPNLDPGFAGLINQTYTPPPPTRDNFTGPTEGAVDGAAPPPEGFVYPWQSPG